MKALIKSMFRGLGYEVSRINPPPPGSKYRPVLDFRSFLEDVRARGFAPSFVLDVGANLGNWTRMTRAIFPSARFLLIEPQVETTNSLNALCAEFPNVSWVLAGAAAANGPLLLTKGQDIGAASFLPQQDPDLVQSGSQRQIDMVTIDQLLATRSLPAPDLVKMDVQGFEIEALKGAESLFGRTELFVLETSLYPFFENMPLAHDVMAFMHQRGYELYDMPGYYRRTLDGALGQVDFAFARQQGTLRQSNRWQ